ncbi:unnamed protein product [marine sediment metagenome]|uniref:Uncharacterized protein n=1 Tax=marine sediment metagenome TaxID=412755 RepID=X0ZBW1_9ZZZZ
MNVWILDSESGITLLYKPYMDLALDEDLISGLLAALNQFTTYEFKQGIESIEMGGLRWSYLEDNEYKLLFIAASEKNISSNMLKARLNVIMQTFIEQYVTGDKENWSSVWKGDTDLFSPFKDVIDEYYTQWLTAENITTIAEYFDILGVFQQILNLLTNLIEAHFPAEKKETIYSQIESMFEHYLSNEYVKNNSELSKFSFSRATGINIINIDPTKCDMIVVEKQIINLVRRIVEMIKKQEGYYVSLHYFIEENIFEYLISNISLLNELNLFKFLLQLFLLK